MTSKFKRITEMNKLSIAIAAVGLMMTTSASAQMTKKPDNTRGVKTQVLEEKDKTVLYGSMTSSMQNGRELVKIQFSEMVQRISPDKAAAKTCLDFENHRFSDTGDALNVLSSHGWHVEQVWTTEDRTGTVVNYLISLEVEKLLPVYPWKDKAGAGKGVSGKDAGGKGAGKAPGKSR